MEKPYRIIANTPMGIFYSKKIELDEIGVEEYTRSLFINSGLYFGTDRGFVVFPEKISSKSVFELIEEKEENIA